MDYTTPPAQICQVMSSAPTNKNNLDFEDAREPFSLDRQHALEQIERTKYHFNRSWFEVVRRDWRELTAPLVGQSLRILEVGSFEGSSTTWILDNLMDHERSTMTVIDWFQGSPEHAGSDFFIDQIERNFCENVQKSRNHEKLRVLKGSSADKLVQLRTEAAKFNLIYIDGSHTAIDVMQDIALSWPMLEVNGTMILDDYRWGLDRPEHVRPLTAIDSFLKSAAPSLIWFERNGQIWAKRIN